MVIPMQLKLNKRLRKQLKGYKIKHQKELYKIPIFTYIKKLVYNGKGLLTEDVVQKCKLISQDDYYFVRKERFLLNLNKRPRKVF